MNIRRPPFYLLIVPLLLLCACQDTQGKPWVEQFDGGAVDAPGPPPDVPDTSDTRPDIDVPPAPDCQQASTTLPAQVKRLAVQWRSDDTTKLSILTASSPNR